MKKFEVIEDDGGGLTLFVFDDAGKVEYAHTGYEFCKGQLRDDIFRLLGSDDNMAEWEGDFEDNPDAEITDQELYNEMLGKSGVEVICDNNGLHSDRMGAAGRNEFVNI